MTGKELIEYIQNNHLEDYTIEVRHDICECSEARDIEADHILKTFEIV